MRCTAIYGHPEMGQKKHMWTLQRRLAGVSNTPWLCIGDFNEILHPSEKVGGTDRSLNMISEFREALQDCNLVDLGCKGYPFTWSNGRFGPHFVEERWDRFLYNEWRDIFYDCAAISLESWSSDHCPVLMDVHERGCGLSYERRSFSRIHYEDMWSYESCKDIVQREWNRHGNWDDVDPV